MLTFGRGLKPNTVNVVPGFTHFTLDCRHTDQAALLRFTQGDRAGYPAHLRRDGHRGRDRLWMDEAPIPMNELVACVSRLCETQAKFTA